jgi:hypothetical protein
VLDARVAPEPPLGVPDRFSGSLPVVTLLMLLGSRPERVEGSRDLVFGAVARDPADSFIPALGRPGLIRALAEGVSDPCRGRLQLALGELVADLAVLPRRLLDRAFKSTALGAHLRGVAQLAGEPTVPCERGFKLAVVGLERTAQVGALDGMRIMLASEPPFGLWQTYELLGELLSWGFR